MGSTAVAPAMTPVVAVMVSAMGSDVPGRGHATAGIAVTNNRGPMRTTVAIEGDPDIAVDGSAIAIVATHHPLGVDGASTTGTSTHVTTT